MTLKQMIEKLVPKSKSLTRVDASLQLDIEFLSHAERLLSAQITDDMFKLLPDASGHSEFKLKQVMPL